VDLLEFLGQPVLGPHALAPAEKRLPPKQIEGTYPVLNTTAEVGERPTRTGVSEYNKKVQVFPCARSRNRGIMKTHLSVFFALILLLLAVISLVGCAGNSVRHPESATTASTTTVPSTSSIQSSTTQTPAGRTQGFTPKYVWIWRESTTGGYKYLTKLGVGDFTHLSAAPLLPEFASKADISSTCGDINEATDAFAPAAVTVTNETKGFSAALSANIYALPPGTIDLGNEPTELSVAVAYSDGTQCSKLTDMDSAGEGGHGWTVQWNNPVGPGESSGISYAYFIIQGYYSPNHPSGNQALLRDALVGPTGIIGLSNPGPSNTPLRNSQNGIDSLNGPGVITRGPYGLVPIIPLNGRQSCLHYETYPRNDFNYPDKALACG
jgi:hypothetical protein